jgi:branched-chain amino acid transport system ATP-binding protein
LLHVLEAIDVSVSFQGVKAVQNVTLRVDPGRIVGLIGPNGAGKTTLVNVLTGFQESTRGAARMDGVAIDSWPPHERARKGMARTFQNVLLFKGLTVLENIESGALAAGLSREESRQRAADILDWLELSKHSDRPAGTLAFGDERRIGIGRAIAMRPRFLLMDEPAAGLNDAECEALERIVLRIRNEIGCGILLIEHRMSIVFALCDHIHVLEQGRTIAEGTTEAIRRNPEVRRAYLGDEVH